MKSKIFIVLVALLGAANLIATAQPWQSFEQNSKYGLIDSQDKVVLEPQYDYINTRMVYAGGSVLVRIADSCFVVNMDTKATSLFADLRHQPAQKLNPAMIAQGDKFGYIDVKGKVIIEGQWDYASPFRDGMARVVIGSGYIYAPSYYPSPGKTGFIDTAGRYVILPEYSYIDDFAAEVPITRFTRGQYVCGDIMGCENPYKSSKWGLIDKTGKIVLQDDKYDFIDKGVWDKKSGKVVFGVSCGEKIGIIDAAGLEIIPLHHGETFLQMFTKYFER